MFWLPNALGTAFLIAPQEVALHEVLASEGIIGALFMGIITAGLSEEFSRMLVQTRVGALLGNKPAGWFIASILWAFMHAPKWYGEDGDLYEALMGSLRIVPLGLLWGYITHRTQSIVPGTWVHGLNVWGLQNF